MTTKKKSEAMKFLEKLAGELSLPGLLIAIRQGEEIRRAERGGEPPYQRRFYG